jgi:hypothetical protein
MRKVPAPLALPRASEWRAAVLFVATVALFAVFAPLIPHRAHTPTVQYTAVNGTVGMNWFFEHPLAKPGPNASTYGLSTHAVDAPAGATFRAAGIARPTGAPGGSICLVLAASIPPSTTPAHTAHECVPLTARWNRLKALKLRTTAPSLVYAEIIARGNGGGFEAHPLVVTRAAS